MKKFLLSSGVVVSCCLLAQGVEHEDIKKDLLFFQKVFNILDDLAGENDSKEAFSKDPANAKECEKFVKYNRYFSAYMEALPTEENFPKWTIGDIANKMPKDFKGTTSEEIKEKLLSLITPPSSAGGFSGVAQSLSNGGSGVPPPPPPPFNIPQPGTQSSSTSIPSGGSNVPPPPPPLFNIPQPGSQRSSTSVPSGVSSIPPPAPVVNIPQPGTPKPVIINLDNLKAFVNLSDEYKNKTEVTLHTNKSILAMKKTLSNVREKLTNDFNSLSDAIKSSCFKYLTTFRQDYLPKHNANFKQLSKKEERVLNNSKVLEEVINNFDKLEANDWNYLSVFVSKKAQVISEINKLIENRNNYAKLLIELGKCEKNKKQYVDDRKALEYLKKQVSDKALWETALVDWGKTGSSATPTSAGKTSIDTNVLKGEIKTSLQKTLNKNENTYSYLQLIYCDKNAKIEDVNLETQESVKALLAKIAVTFSELFNMITLPEDKLAEDNQALTIQFVGIKKNLLGTPFEADMLLLIKNLESLKDYLIKASLSSESSASRKTNSMQKKYEFVKKHLNLQDENTSFQFSLLGNTSSSEIYSEGDIATMEHNEVNAEKWFKLLDLKTKQRELEEAKKAEEARRKAEEARRRVAQVETTQPQATVSSETTPEVQAPQSSGTTPTTVAQTQQVNDTTNGSEDLITTLRQEIVRLTQQNQNFQTIVQTLQSENNGLKTSNANLNRQISNLSTLQANEDLFDKINRSETLKRLVMNEEIPQFLNVKADELRAQISNLQQENSKLNEKLQGKSGFGHSNRGSSLNSSHSLALNNKDAEIEALKDENAELKNQLELQKLIPQSIKDSLMANAGDNKDDQNSPIDRKQLEVIVKHQTEVIANNEATMNKDTARIKELENTISNLRKELAKMEDSKKEKATSQDEASIAQQKELAALKFELEERETALNKKQADVDNREKQIKERENQLKKAQEEKSKVSPKKTRSSILKQKQNATASQAA